MASCQLRPAAKEVSTDSHIVRLLLAGASRLSGAALVSSFQFCPTLCVPDGLLLDMPFP